MAKINDIDLSKWKSYSDIFTDSLWILPSREKGYTRNGDYHGNFVPQIPKQSMLRFTRTGEWVLDPFAGSGTTQIEAKLLSRNSIGIEISEENVEKIKKILDKTPGSGEHITIHGDAMDPETYRHLKNVQLAIIHPPYWDAIRFTSEEKDLSNARTLDEFLEGFSAVVENVTRILDQQRYLVLVIGDIYKRGEVIPLGFLTMNEIMKIGYSLKSIVVKNIEENRGKRGQYSLWRYRALRNGFYIFKHEYVIFFKKK